MQLEITKEGGPLSGQCGGGSWQEMASGCLLEACLPALYPQTPDVLLGMAGSRDEDL